MIFRSLAIVLCLLFSQTLTAQGGGIHDFDLKTDGILLGTGLFTFGLGISACLAELAAYIFTEHGLRATCLSTRYTSPRDQLVFLRQTDVVLAFSFPPYSRQTPDVLQEAIERGATTLAITDHLSAPVSGRVARLARGPPFEPRTAVYSGAQRVLQRHAALRI